jgi:hypothetical protein
VYKSDYRYLIASTIITTTFVLLISTMFIGWWEMGRSFTMNPIEIAKAFDAPLMQGPGSNVTSSELVKSMGRREVRFGEVESDVDGRLKRKLKLADPVEVTKPRSGVLYA